MNRSIHDTNGLMAGRTVGVRVLLFAIFTVALFWNATIVVASPTSGQTDPDNVRIRQQLDYKLVAGVLKQLRNVARQRQRNDLYRLLAKVRIATPHQSMYAESPNAYAFSDDSKGDWIIVEERWLGQIAGFAELGALFALREARWGLEGQLLDFYNDYCARFQQRYRAWTTSSPPVVHQFAIGDYISRSSSENALLLMMYDKLAGLVFINTVAWTVLHEMGHHALQHTTASAVPEEDQRKNELAADQWAFQEMETLGYSLYPVAAYFLAREWSEHCFHQLGLVADEVSSTHPHWSTRGDALYDGFRWRRASNQASRSYFVPGANANIDGPFYFTITISDQSKHDPQATLVQFQRGNLGIVEWEGGRATVYIREASGGRFEYILKNPYDMMVSIMQRLYDRQNRYVSTLELQAVQQDAAAMDFLEVGRLRFADIRARFESGDLWKRHLRNLGVSQAEAQRTLETRNRYIAERFQIVAKYMKGEQSAAGFEGDMTGYQARYKAALIDILGAKTYETLKTAVTREVETFAPGITEGRADWESSILKENLGQ